MNPSNSDVEYELGVTKIGPHSYQSNEPLQKPAPSARGAYGGFIAGQALLVAMKSSPPGFTPHSLHSFFTKPTSSTEKIIWEVDEINNGKNFVNRSLKATQGGQTKYIANISLTKKNSFKAANDKYEEYKKRQATKKHNDNDNDDDDDSDESPIPKPFGFQTPYPKWLKDQKPEELDFSVGNGGVSHKYPIQMISLDSTKDEESLDVTERRLSYFVKWGEDKQLTLKDPDTFKFVGLGVLSDSLFLLRLARILRVNSVDHSHLVHYYSVSLDHIMYFHDDDFDPTKWMAFGFKAARFNNDRVLLEAEMYNDKGTHVCSIIQEGLVHLNGIELEAKL